jgi:hypothetical protein
MADFDYPLDDLRNPRGKNGLTSLANFYQRNLYRDEIYPKDGASALDTWHDKFLYGRIDTVQNTIVPSTQNLVSIPSGLGTNLLALNGVVNAFEKMVDNVRRKVIMGGLNSTGNSVLRDPRAVRAYENAQTSYSYFTQSLFNNFVSTLRGKEKFQIKDFSSFVKIYSQYLLNIARVTPLTRTNYLLSSNASLFTTGLSIAIANDDASNDAVKYEDFIADPNFLFFKECAKKYGFVLNKNAPWILTADLFTSAFAAVAMDNYAAASGEIINRNNFFDMYYNPTYLTDFDDLIRILVNSYNEFLIKEPFYDKEVGALNDKCSIAAKPRKPLGVKAAEIIEGTLNSNVLPDKLVIDFYIDLRQIEVDNPLSPLQLRSVKRGAYDRYMRKPSPGMTAFQNVAKYVNTIYRQYIYSRGNVFLQLLNRKTY